MRSKIEGEIVKDKKPVCRNCGNNKGMIRRYGLNLCRRCFKDLAEKMGFKKYG